MNEHTPWRLYLALGALAGVGVLLLLLWPAARALSAAVVQAIEQNGDLVAGGLLAFGALLALGLLRILFAIGRRFEAQAKQARVVQMQNSQPVLVDDIKRYADQTLGAALAAWSAKQLAEAERSQYPQLSSYSYHVRNDAPPPLLEAEPIDAAPIVFDPHRPLLAQLHERGHICRSGKSLLVGYDMGGQPLYIELPECGFIGVGGQPRVGKTTLVSLLLAQAALMQWHIALGDPHIHKDDGLIQRCTPISGHCIRQAATPEEIAVMIRYVDKIGRARVNGDADRTPVFVVLDEFTNLVIRKLLPDDVLAALPAMAMEYAGVGVHGIIIGHDWNGRLLGGDLGAALRRAITHRLVCRSDSGNAEFLLPNAAIARQAAGLQKGQALYWGTDAPAVALIPRIAAEDLVYAAQGTPPRPYQPRALAAAPAAAAPPLAPTQPIAVRAAPPTEHIGVQTQIRDLLRARRGWLTSSEIAQALAIDVRVVRTELTPLVDSRSISRRPAQRKGPEKYEYACESTSQPLNAHIITPSA